MIKQLGEKKPSLESIDFQGDTFFKALTDIFREAREAFKGKTTDEQRVLAIGFSDRLTAVIHEQTNANIVATIDDDIMTRFLGPYSMSPQLDKNHSLINDMRREYHTNKDLKAAVPKSAGKLLGTVDLRTGKISGELALMRAEVHMPMRWTAESDFSPEEMAAVTLHEVGHISTFFEFLARTVSTNQVLAYVAKTYNGLDYNERKKVLVDAKFALKLKNIDVDELAKLAEAKDVSVVIVSDTIAESRSELGSNIYDTNAWEQLADDYAARHGAGRYMITSLEKLHKGDFAVAGRAAYFMMEAVKIVLLITTGLFMAIPGLGLYSIIFILGYFGRVSRDSNKQSLEYDTPKDRMQRIRNQLVAAIKEKNTPKEVAQQYTEDIRVVDEVLAGISGNRQLWDVVREFVNPYARKYRNQMLLQRELEDLAANDLFVAHAELKNNL